MFPFHDLAMVFFICLDLDSADLVSALVHMAAPFRLGHWMQIPCAPWQRKIPPFSFPPVLTLLTELLLPSVYVDTPFPDLAETERDLETTGSAAAAEILRGTEPMAAAEGLETAEPCGCIGDPKRH